MPEEEKKERVPELRIPVRIVKRTGETVLVEWIDEAGLYRRVGLPQKRVTEGTVTAKDLEKGMPYGVSWENFINVEATPESIANELRRQGVWTVGDISNAAVSAANRAFDQGEFIRRVVKEASK